MDGWELSFPSPSNPAAELLPASGFGFERWIARLGCVKLTILCSREWRGLG